MCEIAGIINLRGGEVSRADLKKMIELAKHRGPDGEGCFIRKNVGLGHRRLSIIDLSKNGSQPMSNQDASLHITYNGEIYNYIELRDELKKIGHQFISTGDTEVILHAYEAWGQKAFSKFNGDWALAIFDQRENKVILSRDRFSVKPLYYMVQNSHFYFASEIKQLLPFLSKKELNMQTMYSFLKQGLLDSNEQTFFKNIVKVKPKHNVVIDLETGAIKEYQYWEYALYNNTKSFQEQMAEFRELFIDAVKIRLRSDVSVGGLLSGGLDSSIMSLVAYRLTGGNFKCFSVVSNDKNYSEERFVDIMANEAGVKSTKLFITPQNTWDDVVKVLKIHDEPFTSFSVVAQHQIINLVKKETGIKVLLTGQGGDEILCGYRKFFFFYLQQELKKGRLLNVSKNLILSLFLKTIARQLFLSGIQRYSPSFQKLRKDPLDEILISTGTLQPIWRAESLRERQIDDIDHYSIPSINHHEDLNSMAHSVEIRLPFLDYRLVNYALSLPDDVKIRNGWTKYIARKSFSDLPPQIAWRKDKQGFTVPEEKWLQVDFKDNILELFSSSKLHDIGVIDKNKFLKVYKKFLSEPDWQKIYYDLRRFVLAELWLQNI